MKPEVEPNAIEELISPVPFMSVLVKIYYLKPIKKTEITKLILETCLN